jgi:hypothetical protein
LATQPRDEIFLALTNPLYQGGGNLPVVNRYAGRSLREFWRELDTWSARLLVLAMYPLAIALTLFHSLKIAQGTARAGEGTSLDCKRAESFGSGCE